MATPLLAPDETWDTVLEHIGDASIVLLGEATHGTHEFYTARAAITRRLVEERGFSALCIEGDLPHSARAHRWLRSEQDGGAADALAGFKRFPQWMWRNTAFCELLDELRTLARRGSPIGLYGLDLYSMHESMAEVVAILERLDPAEARRARARYSCFEHFGEDPQSYGWATSSAGSAPCEDDVVAELKAIHRLRVGDLGSDDALLAEFAAMSVKGGEAYYRTMFRGRVSSWNLRDTHMADALETVRSALARPGHSPKVVVWAHNSHLGDARATELGDAGELNLGQLLRAKHGSLVRSIGFSTHEGSVTAATDWDAPARRRHLRRGMRGSYEELFHLVGVPQFFLDLRELGEASGALHEDRLQRAVGVIYRPETERQSHYFHARLADQFDGIIHIDHTHALEPLEREALWVAGEAPETWPSSL
jgi:erythromycin esterase-like protein